MNYQALTFLIIQHIIGLLSIGPCTALVIRNSLYNRKQGLKTVLGATFGSFSVKSLSIIGLAALLAHSPQLLKIFKLTGGAFLIFLGLKSFTSTYREFRKRNLNNQNQFIFQNSSSPFIAGYLMSIANPMSSIRFIALFTTVITIKTPLLIQFSYLVVLAFISLIFYGIVALFFSNDKIQAIIVHFNYLLSFILGITLVYWGLKIL